MLARWARGSGEKLRYSGGAARAAATAAGAAAVAQLPLRSSLAATASCPASSSSSSSSPPSSAAASGAFTGANGRMQEPSAYPMFPNSFLPRSTVVKNTGRKHTATLFLFHGSGGNGDDFKQWLDILNRYEMTFPHIKIVYVTSPIQPYTPNQGLPSHVWFNRAAISIHVPEIKHSINLICNKISELIYREVSEGIPIDRIVVGGFSMGGCLAMHLAYRINRSLAGCIAMSAFLNDGSSVYKTLASTDATSESRWPKLLQFHGNADKVVPLEWGTRTFDNLQKLGVQGTFIPLCGADHEILQNELIYIKDWLLEVLPQTNE